MATFTAGELEVMQVLWDRGPLTPGQMQANFPRPVHNATLRSMLLVLLEKGHVARRKEGRAYVYEARTPQRNTLKKLVRRLTDVFCGGSPTALIAHIIQSEKLSADDIQRLRRILNQTGQTTQPAKKGGRR